MRKKLISIDAEKIAKEQAQQGKTPKTEKVSTTEIKRRLDLILTYGRNTPNIEQADIEKTEQGQIKVTFPYTFVNIATSRKKQKGYLWYTFPTLEQLKGNNDTTKKILNHILSKMYEQVPLNPDGTPAVNSFSFPTQEIKDLCGFTDKGLHTANKALDKLSEVLKDLQISYGGSSTERALISIISLFTTYRRENATATYILNPASNLKPLFEYMSNLPLFSYRLEGKPYNLLSHIITMARYPKQNRSIAEKGYFIISIDDIIKTLALPHLDKDGKMLTKSPNEKIKEPILEALEAIKQEYADKYGQGVFDYKILTPLNDVFQEQDLADDEGNYIEETGKQPVREWIKNKVKIEFSGVVRDFHKQILEQQKHKQKKVKYERK